MRKLLPFLLVIAGCSAGDSDDLDSCYDIAHEYTYDIVGETGLMLVATTPHYSFITFEEMEAEYIDVEACAANTGTPGPTVVFTSFNDYPFQLELALYYYAIQTVFIDTDNEPWLPVRNCISDREFLRHEYMHHVLHLNGEDPSHANPKFAACDALGPKTCNGEYCD
jgi:hypothetical protein